MMQKTVLFEWFNILLRTALIPRLVVGVLTIGGLCVVKGEAVANETPVKSLSEPVLLQLLQQPRAHQSVVLENATYRMEFDAAGAMQSVMDKRTNVVRDIEHMRGLQFKLTSRIGEAAWQEHNLNAMVLLDDGRSLLVGDAERQIAFVFEVEWTEHYLRFDLQRMIAPEPITLGTLSFDFYIDGQAKIYPLDYMTDVRAHGPRLRATLPWLWGVESGEHMGSFALTLPDDDLAEDEALLHLWVDGCLPQPKVEGEWTLERAREWLADWQSRYVDQSTMIVQPTNPAELYQLCKQALSMGMRRIYLHTDVWRGEYWPRTQSFLHVNREVFPEGEVDLKKLADSLAAQDVGLAVHTVSMAIGGMDPDYVKGGLDPRLANWVQSELVESVDARTQTIRIRPKNRDRLLTVHEAGPFGPNQHYSFLDITAFSIGDELIQAGQIRELEPGLWELSGCQRGIYETEATAHIAGAAATGLYRAYRQAFVAGVESSLLPEVAERFGDFCNRIGLSHVECDGLENHLSHPWGRSKFTWLLYQQIDHPTTSNTSSGRSLPWHIEYWFKSSAQVRANHPTGGVAGGEGVPLYVHHDVRPATGPYEIHLKPTERMGLGGESVHLMRPKPMFGVSADALETHGLSGMFMESICLWKRVLQAISEGQRQSLKVPYVESSNPFPIRQALDRLYRPVENVSGLALQGFQAVQPVGNRINWAWMQERGPNVPRSYLRVGDAPVEMAVPNGGRNIEFTLRVLPSFRPEDRRANVEATMISDSGLSEVERDYMSTGQGASSVEGQKVGSKGAASVVGGGRSLMPLQTEYIRNHQEHQFEMKEGYLNIAYSGEAVERVVNQDRPLWRCDQLRIDRNDGVRLVVFGDGSGANLVVTLHAQGRRDFVFPIDFTGRRELFVPAGIASWARGDWGWRMETTHFSYGELHQVEVGFGGIPKGASPRVTIEALDLVAGYTTSVNKLSLLMGDAALQIDGVVHTDEYIWYQGGDAVQVYDLNWNMRRSLPVKRKGFQFEAGDYPMQFWAEDTQPHVELQMMSFEDPIPIR